MKTELSQTIDVGHLIYVVEGYDYPSDADSIVAFNNAREELRDLTICRVHSIDHTQFQIFVCYPETNEEAANFYWGGTQFTPNEKQIDWMVMRRLKELDEMMYQEKSEWQRWTHFEKNNPHFPGG